MSISGAVGSVVTVGLGWAISPEPLGPREWLYAIVVGLGAGAGLALLFGVPIAILGLASDAGEAISVAVEDRRERLAHKASPARGLLSEPNDDQAGGLSDISGEGELSELEEP